MGLSEKALLLTIVVGQIFLPVYSGEREGEINAGSLIDQVILGTDFTGRELIISGIALTQTGSGKTLLNLGTLETFQSGVHKNYISIWDTNAKITEGSPVTIRVLVEESSAQKLGGEDLILINSMYRECLSC